MTSVQEPETAKGKLTKTDEARRSNGLKANRCNAHPEVPMANVHAGLRLLAEINLQVIQSSDSVSFPGGRHLECYLLSSSTKQNYFTLGPYARMLVAVKLLAGHDYPSSRYIGDVIGIDPKWRAGRPSLRRMFGQRVGDGRDEVIKTDIYYLRCQTSLKADAAAIAKLIYLVIAKLNQSYADLRGLEITWIEFFETPITVDKTSAVVGTGLAEQFEKWLQYGIGAPSRDPFSIKKKSPVCAVYGKAGTHWETLIRKLHNLQTSPMPHRRIINIHGVVATRRQSDVAAMLVHQLNTQSRQPSSVDDRVFRDVAEPPMSVIYINLQPQTTRLKVLELLYEELNLPKDTLSNVLKGARTIDIFLDLEPIRRSLTVNRIVIIFDGWRNAAGPFESVRELLTNAQWGEFFRILAQPSGQLVYDHTLELKRNSHIVVISTNIATDLSPWVTTLLVNDVWESSKESAAVHPPLVQKLLKRIGSEALSTSEAQLLGAVRLDESLVNSASLEKHSSSPTQGVGLYLMRIWMLGLSDIEQLAIRLVAASPNGMRPSTLLRCMREWCRLFCPTGPAAPLNIISRLRVAHHGIIEAWPDDEIEQLTSAQRELELGRRPVMHDTHNDTEGGKPVILTIVNEEIRGLLIANWLRNDSDLKSDCTNSPMRYMSWGHINFILAEESLLQGTSQLLHQPAEIKGQAHEWRRIIQALIHGVASLEVGDFAEQQYLSLESLGGVALPTDPAKRYRYLVTFVYKEMIEGGRWRLGRSFGQSRLRLELLTILVNPAVAPLVFAPKALTAQQDAASATELLPKFPLTSLNEVEDLPIARIDSPQLWCNLVEAIGRAGCDLGGAVGERAVTWALERLPHYAAPARVNKWLPVQEEIKSRLTIEALKLRVDWYQSRGDAELLRQAEAICWAELENSGIDRPTFENPLYKAVRSGLSELRVDKPSGIASIFEAMEASRQTILRMIPTPNVYEHVVDFLFRLGEVLATKADDMITVMDDRDKSGRSQPISDDKLQEFGRAFAIYWIADRIRSDSARSVTRDIKWQRASARAMRYYIRVILKLAGLVTDGNRDRRSQAQQSFTHLMLEHAQERIGVYIRHHHQFRRERDTMLLLEVSRLRAWARLRREQYTMQVTEAQHAYQADPRTMQADQIYRSATERFKMAIEEQHYLLERCRDWIAEAESLLISLGFQTAHVRRLFLERVKTAVATLNFGVSAHQTYVTQQQEKLNQTILDAWHTAVSSLDALREVSRDHEFWAIIVARQQVRLQQVLSLLEAKGWKPPYEPHGQGIGHQSIRLPGL